MGLRADPPLSTADEDAPVVLVGTDPTERHGRRVVAVVAALAVVVVGVVVALLVRPGGVASGPAGPPPPEPERSVVVEVRPAVVEPGGVVTAVLVASEANNLTFGVVADVDRWDGWSWRRAGVSVLCLVEWQCVASVDERYDGAPDIGLTAVPGTPAPATLLGTEGLADGWYRLSQRANGGSVATGVFEVRTGATAAPPVPSPDDVRLSVDPVLVPPEGGLVRVVTQVPMGPDGTLTAEQVEAVDSSLAPSARVQRWDGTTWLDVADVPVGEREPGLGAEWGSPVALPPLEEGSYRVVRDRTGAAPVWGLVTVTRSAPALEQPDDVSPAPSPDGGPPPEDVFAPDHPMCAEQAGRCLLEAWWRDVVAASGLERGGGDHDYGVLLTDSFLVTGDRALTLALFPAEAPPAVPAVLTVESSRDVGAARVESGLWEDGTAGRRVTCGGLVVQTAAPELGPEETDHLVDTLARAMGDCPADLAALAARYPEHPPLP